MTKYAIVNSDGTVENIVVADRVEDAFPPPGSIAIVADADAEVGGTHDGTNFVPVPRPPPPPPTATGAQMIDEADAQSKLDMLTAALTPSEMAIFVTRRRITAGSNVAEMLRARLGVSAAAMESFIAAASVRGED